jgi:copper chaperone CopZ
MKYFFFILFFFSASISKAQFSKASLQATGLTCALCTKAIDEALKGISFVATVTPNIKQSSFDIVFKSGLVVDADVLKNTVEEAGFFVSQLQLTGTFEKVLVKNDAHVVFNHNTYHFLQVNEQLLEGEKTITLVDKNFVPTKMYKKYSAYTQMQCMQTGKATEDCVLHGAPSGGHRIYHVTLL